MKKIINITSRSITGDTKRNIKWKQLSPPYSQEEELNLIYSKHPECIQHIQKKVRQYYNQDLRSCTLNVEQCNNKKSWKKTRFYSILQEGKKNNNDKNIKPISISLEETIELLKESNLYCYYCNEPVVILYTKWREPKQWSLDRIDNRSYHTKDNCVVSCLQCNLQRRERDFQKFKQSKVLTFIQK